MKKEVVLKKLVYGNGDFGNGDLSWNYKGYDYFEEYFIVNRLYFWNGFIRLI